MKSDSTGKTKNGRRVELKYCEGCGGLGVRECGGGQIYCDDCAKKMAKLAVANTAPRRINLPVGNRSLLDDAADSDNKDFNAPNSNDSNLNDRNIDDRNINDRSINDRSWRDRGLDDPNLGDSNSDDAGRDDSDFNDLDAMAWITTGGAA